MKTMNVNSGKTKMKRIQRQADIEEFAAEKLKADIAFARLPKWKQEQLEGDYHYDVMEPRDEA